MGRSPFKIFYFIVAFDNFEQYPKHYHIYHKGKRLCQPEDIRDLAYEYYCYSFAHLESTRSFYFPLRKASNCKHKLLLTVPGFSYSYDLQFTIYKETKIIMGRSPLI